MPGAFVAAWLTGEAIIIWRVVHNEHRLPVPGQILGVSALFVGLAVIAEFPKAAPLATALAWGLDIAALMNVLPAGLSGQISQAQATSATAEGITTGTTGTGPGPVAT